MKFDVSGASKPLRDREPGTVLGEKRICCHRCGEEYPESELTTIPPNAEPGRPRVYVCRKCL